MRSPTLSVGSIDAEGMKKVWTTKVRMPNATASATSSTAPHSSTRRHPRRRRTTVTSRTTVEDASGAVVAVGAAVNGLLACRGAATNTLPDPFVLTGGTTFGAAVVRGGGGVAVVGVAVVGAAVGGAAAGGAATRPRGAPGDADGARLGPGAAMGAGAVIGAGEAFGASGRTAGGGGGAPGGGVGERKRPAGALGGTVMGAGAWRGAGVATGAGVPTRIGRDCPDGGAAVPGAGSSSARVPLGLAGDTHRESSELGRGEACGSGPTTDRG